MNRKDEFDRIVNAIAAYRIPADSEIAMQTAIERVLTQAGFEFSREVVLSKEDRIDFLVGQTGLECKIAGGFAAVAQQVGRYLDHQQVSGLILVSSKPAHNRIFHISGKRFQVVIVGGL